MLEFRDCTIVFDLDGTLVDTAPDLIGATNHALADIGLGAVPGAALRPWISFGARRMIEEGLRHSGEVRPATEVDRLLALFLGHYEANIAVVSRPYPGAVEALGAILDAGGSLAVCTNKRESLSLRLLTELDLVDYFAAIVGRDTLAACKPDPLHLTGAIEMAGGARGAAVMVGDSGVDIQTARAASIPVVGVTFGYTDTPIQSLGPDAVIDHYDRLLGVLPGLLARS
ncbi:MAG: phosphoglycolate phosphatase [Hyphomicrobiaceae bacterium]|nr:phosphoglycolate phosphatase [Hyphomicrobiaceae bacterium]